MIIGLVGHIGSGKGSVADFLVEAHGFMKESFARSVKDAVSIIFGWDRASLEGDTIHSRKWREEPDAWWSERMGRNFSPREALQLMGTEAGRDIFHKDLWIYSMERRINIHKKYVIADVRFLNEIESIKKLGGYIVRVQRKNPSWYNDAVRYINGETKEKPDAHYSEWDWMQSSQFPNFDCILHNNRDLIALENKVDLMLEKLYD